MTLIFFDGFQDAATVPKPEWTPGIVMVAITGRDGSTNGAMRLNNNNDTKQLNLPSAAATCIMGFAFKAYTNVYGYTGSGHALAIMGTGTGTRQFFVVISNTGFLEVRRGTSYPGILIGTSSGHASLVPDVWHHLQIKALLSTSAGSVELVLDGVTALTLTGVVNSTVTGAVTIAGIGQGNAPALEFDDLWVCDAVDATATQGRPNNDYLGDLKVSTLIPTGNGDLTAWAKSTGTNAAALVDEVPPNTTDYISTNTSAARELMVLPDLVAGTVSVYGLRVVLYGQKSDAGSCSVKPLLKETGGTITAQTAKPLTILSSGYYGEFLFTKPSASTTPWTPSDVNALQAGVELA